jgi:hypothetical protein
MAATSTKSSAFIPDLEAATERAGEANDRLAEAGRRVAIAYLNVVETYVAEFAKFERKLGERIKVDAIASLVSTHAQLTEEVAKVSASAARDLIIA